MNETFINYVEIETVDEDVQLSTHLLNPLNGSYYRRQSVQVACHYLKKNWRRSEKISNFLMKVNWDTSKWIVDESLITEYIKYDENPCNEGLNSFFG